MHSPIRRRERVLREVGFTTNNRMELTAVIAGLRPLTRPCVITALNYSDYVRPGITEFLPRWRSVVWRNSAGKPVLNREWEELDTLASEHHVSSVYVRGHSGHPEQESATSWLIKQPESWHRPLHLLEMLEFQSGIEQECEAI